MKQLIYVASFAVILLVSTGISFVGYRYLALANEYREANFEHLDAVYQAIDLIRQKPAPTRSDIDTLLAHTSHANAQAVWCIDNLSAIDRRVFSLLGADEALQICDNAIVTGESAVDFLNALKEDKINGASSMTASFILYSQTIGEIERLRDLSVSFQPYVTRIQTQLEILVRTGTGLVSVLLFGMTLAVAKQLIRAQTRIRIQSLTDPLTALHNRRGLDRVLTARMAEDEVILARIDLDRFKQVNDIMGHEAGDFVLNHVAGLMRAHSRAGDNLARVGGDEFVILFRADTTAAEARNVLEGLLKDIAEPVRYKDKQCVFGASFGLASTGFADLQVGDLLNAADNALYEVKRTGRGTIAEYTRSMHRRIVGERGLADRFREALKNEEVVPYFQTQHFSKDWRLSGIEVLARWEHPTAGVLTPDKFLGLAAQLGVEAELDRVIFRQSVKHFERLTAAGHDIPRLAFNVSAGRLTDPTFMSDIRESIPTGRERFAFEILESVYYEDANETFAFVVDAIKELGFRLDVDDFGSGHASINSVLKIEPHTLKIDRNIIRPIAESPQALRMTASIVELASALNMEVIAEGVDTAEKADLLRDMGCHALQGFFFSKPMSVDALEAFLQNAEPRSQISA